MRYPNWKQLTIFCVSLLTCFFAETIYVFSCGPEPEPYDYYANFFNPDLSSSKGFEPFYYTIYQPFYGESEDAASINLQEWKDFFSAKGTKITNDDIEQFLYNYSREEMAELYKSIDKGTSKVPDQITKNAISKYFINSKDLETLGYMMFAKQCEVHAQGGEEEWTTPKRDSVTMMRLARNGIQLYNACKDAKIKERFAFQAIRMAHYSNNFKTAIHYYDSLTTSSSTIIHYKSLALKAGALLRSRKPAESAYAFSRVFEAVPSLRTMAYQNTGWAAANKNAVLRLCANNTEKATVAAMYAFRTVDVNPAGLREVYRLDPASPILDVLLAREVNKLEESYLQSTFHLDNPNYLISDPAPGKADVNILQKLTDSIAMEGKVKEPALWQITSAYLSFMQKDYTGANTRLAAAKPQRSDLKDQQEIVQLLVNINEQKAIDKTFEAKLLSSLKWLDSRLPKDRKWYENHTDNKWISEYFYVRMYRNLLDYVLLPRYVKQNDPTRQALVMVKRDKVNGTEYYYYGPVSGKGYLTDSLHTDQLIAFRNLWKSRNKTSFEQYMFDQLPIDEKQLDEIIAINFIRQHDFSNAVAWFKNSGTSGARTEDVFTEQLQDFGYEDPDSLSKSAITELEYASRMMELEKKMKGKNVAPEVYYQYATGLFSISYYGHSYRLVSDYRPSTDWYSPEDERTPFLREYFGCYRAEEYYKKAADAATDREFKAKALYMAARCAQKHIPDGDGSEWWYPATHQNPYFPRLVKESANTEFYNNIITECSYLKDYVKAQKP